MELFVCVRNNRKKEESPWVFWIDLAVHILHEFKDLLRTKDLGTRKNEIILRLELLDNFINTAILV